MKRALLAVVPHEERARVLAPPRPTPPWMWQGNQYSRDVSTTWRLVHMGPPEGGVHSLLTKMDATFICARCSKPNASTSNLPAGSCDHATCRGLLCEACSDFHDTSNPPGHGFKWARDMDDGGDPAATPLDIPVKSSPAPKPPAPASTPAPGPPHDASAETMIAEMHTLHEAIEAGVASVNAATSVRTLNCECLRLPRVACTTCQNASLVVWRRRRRLYTSRRRAGAP